MVIAGIIYAFYLTIFPIINICTGNRSHPELVELRDVNTHKYLPFSEYS
jgi:hypothetical protein